jgi:nitroimidazol reductase NimA-like FMN-containing flavoprotein (pyridoxamine 5'-phosphate oxidase superfamily)
MRRKDREVTDENIIRDIFTRADVCRLAFVDGEIPYIVAMNFGVQFGESGDPVRLYFHSSPKGRKIDLIQRSLQKNTPVCFQIDIDHTLRPDNMACNCSMNYKSIVGYGKIRFLDDAVEKQKGLDFIMDQYEIDKRGSYEYSEKDLKMTTVLELVVDSLTCKMREM